MPSELTCPQPVDGSAFVYVLESADGTLYVGHACDVRERLRKHRLGLGSKHTHDHPGVRLIHVGLIHVEGPLALDETVRRERQLKGWSRAKKLALISGDISRLKQLSRGREHSVPHKAQ